MFLVHFDGGLASGKCGTEHPVDACSAADPVDVIQWFPAVVHSRVFFLLPDSLKTQEDKLVRADLNGALIWYSNDLSFSIPEASACEDVWVINATQWSSTDWGAAQSTARQRDCDVLVFASSLLKESDHYVEFLRVEETGKVMKCRRNYTDAPASVDLWAGPVSSVVCAGEHARSVVAHLIVHGWGLDSIGLLTRRFHVEWSQVSSGRPKNGATAGLSWAVAGTADRSLSDQSAPEYNNRHELASVPGQDDPRDYRTYRYAKRLIDMSLSAFALLTLLPLFLVVAALLKLTSRGPVFFGHKRQGVGGKEFQCLKFRTMIAGADAMQDQLRGENEVDGPQFKIAKDPRLTRLGAWLRRYNVDELPQLINVLRGEMSLVGPRPSPDDENQFCAGWRRARLSVPPGITGLWQVMRLRNDPASDFQEWIYYDLEYAKHRSVWLDFQLLLYTPVAIFSPRRLGWLARRLEQRGICAHSPRIRHELLSAAHVEPLYPADSSCESMAMAQSISTADSPEE